MLLFLFFRIDGKESRDEDERRVTFGYWEAIDLLKFDLDPIMIICWVDAKDIMLAKRTSFQVKAHRQE